MKHEKPNESPAHEAKESKALEAREIKTGRELSTKKGFPKRSMGRSRWMPGMEATMHEFKHGTLRSSSGQKVKKRAQAIAIGMSEDRRAGKRVAPRRVAGGRR